MSENDNLLTSCGAALGGLTMTLLVLARGRPLSLNLVRTTKDTVKRTLLRDVLALDIMDA